MSLIQTLMLNEEQSYTKAQRRISQSNTFIGSDVTVRMLRYCLYVLGFSYRFISSNLNISEAGLKTLVQETHKNGLIRFLDKRKANINPPFPDTVKHPITERTGGAVETSGTEEYNEFRFNAPLSIKLKKTDKLSNKVLTSILVDAGALKQIDAASVLSCSRLAVNRNCKKYETEGAKGLIDKRIGQRRDYKITSEIKYGIIKEYLSSIFNDVAPSINIVTEQLNKNGSDIFSEKAIAIHMKKLGLIDNKRKFISEISGRVNSKVDALELLCSDNRDPEKQEVTELEMLKKIKKGLSDCCAYSETARNLFHTEEKIAQFNAELHASVLETIIKKIRRNYVECPSCHSSNISDIANRKKSNHKQIKTSSGALLSSDQKFYGVLKCGDCNHKFDFMKEILSFSDKAGSTPLAQKKICSANRAGSYENAAKNLKELINLDINRNQVREISRHVGDYIENEFSELSKSISRKESSDIIQKNHPLVKELKIDRRYLDQSKYLICVAADGGRMQMFNWIPPDKNIKRKKKLYWHENKVFRISIYDKQILRKIEDDTNDNTKKRQYRSMKMVPDLTTYAATNKAWKDSAELVEGHLYMRGIKPEDVQLCISDGSEHIEREIFEYLFPKATHILDYYHKTEALHECIKIAEITGTKTAKGLQDYLWEGKIKSLLKSLKKLQRTVGFPEIGGKRDSEDPKVKFDCFINHIEKNSHRLQYQKYKNLRYPIGSGSVESAVKLFGKRIKGTEKQWNDDGGEAILHLYSFLLSEDNRWEKLWKVQTPWI